MESAPGLNGIFGKFSRRRHALNTLLVAAAFGGQVLWAQHTHNMSQSGSSNQLPVLVDGSKTPDKIPDNLAYQHFFAAVAAHPSPSAQELARQNAQLLPLNLSTADRQNLVQALAVFRTGLDPIGAALRSQPTPAQAASLRQQKDELLANARTALSSSLTADGLGKLDEYVKTRVKKHIIIYGGAM
jgi:hypothetical protein